MRDSRAVLVETPLMEHPAVSAWTAHNPGGRFPTSVEVVSRGRKPTSARVFRLCGVEGEGGSVIAKRDRRSELLIEQTVYEQILPQLAVESPRYFGSVEDEEDGFSWLFLEMIDGERYSESSPTHRRLASNWFGRAHAAASRFDVSTLVPRYGAEHYLEYLQAARTRILGDLDNPALDGQAMEVLTAILAHCEVLESRWDEIDDFCARMPCTLIHGDFLPKNARIRTERRGSALYLFDWGSAAWTIPAEDLAGLEIDAYHSCVSSTWPELDRATVEQLESIGTIFRSLALISEWSLGLGSDRVEQTINELAVHDNELVNAWGRAGFRGDV